MGTLREDN